MSVYPIGAKWKAEANRMIGEIWLERTIGKIQVWKWSVKYQSGAYVGGDWGTSKNMVRDECSVTMSLGSDRIRFKRVE